MCSVKAEAVLKRLRCQGFILAEKFTVALAAKVPLRPMTYFLQWQANVPPESFISPRRSEKPLHVYVLVQLPLLQPRAYTKNVKGSPRNHHRQWNGSLSIRRHIGFISARKFHERRQGVPYENGMLPQAAYIGVGYPVYQANR